MKSKKIWTHLVYSINHDERHKAGLVDDEHITNIPVESVYSGFVSLYHILLLVFISETNKMETWDTDTGNAYFEANSLDKTYIIAGTEFCDK